MDHFQLIFFAVFAFVAATFVFGRLKYGSWTGAFLKGSIEQTYGEILLSAGVASSQVLKVAKLRDGNGEAFVGACFHREGAPRREHDAVPTFKRAGA
jgi:hypothetical protein